MTRTYHPVGDPRHTPRPSRASADAAPRARGRHRSKFERGRFVAWDGEGLTFGRGETARHVYALLCNSLGDVLESPRTGLSTTECLEALAAVGETEPHAIHVAFAHSYDVNMMLAECSRAQVRRIWDGEWTGVGDFVVQYLPRKTFSVRRRKAERSALVLWDVFGFFQSSFVGALDKYGIVRGARLERLADMKRARATFTAREWARIRRYCQSECRYLVALCERLRGYLIDADLRIRRWDGAGAVAAALLTRQGVAHHMAETPGPVQRAARHAYAGGRTELYRYGHAPRTAVYHYDINSAYPTAMLELPSLAGGEWRRVTSPHLAHESRYPFALWRVRWRAPSDTRLRGVGLPFFWRDRHAAIWYPREGEGWYWTPEIGAARLALDVGLYDRVELLDLWAFTPATDEKPFSWVPPLYAQRAEWKRAGIGAEKVLKLGINSLYGKTAQHVGAFGMRPRFHQLEWAGYVTSRTRAALYRAMLPAFRADAALMCATDAVYSLVPLALPTGDALGAWSATTHTGITIVQSGVYWTHDGPDRELFCRGFESESMSLRRVLRHWRRRRTHSPATVRRFLTMGSALMGGELWDGWRSWRRTPRALALTPAGTKRILGPEHGRRPPDGAAGLIATWPATPRGLLAGPGAGPVLSWPYPLPWELPEGTDRYDRYDGVPGDVIEWEVFDTDE